MNDCIILPSMLTSGNIFAALPRLIFINVNVVFIVCVLKLRVRPALSSIGVTLDLKKVWHQVLKNTLVSLWSFLVLRSNEQNETIAMTLQCYFNGYFALVNAWKITAPEEQVPKGWLMSFYGSYIITSQYTILENFMSLASFIHERLLPIKQAT